MNLFHRTCIPLGVKGHSSAQQSFHQTRAPSAFTLIELLVVLAIIGILASLLLPVLARAKNKASQVVDINNFKQLTTALHLYTTDNRDTMPWPNWAAGDRPDRPGWLYTLDTKAKGPARFRPETGLLWDSLQTGKLYLCPMDKPDGWFSSRQQQISSYVMNGAVIGYRRMHYPPLRMSHFRPQDVVFWETDEKKPSYFNDGASFPSEGVSARHLQGAINATFDGSVSHVKLADWQQDLKSTQRNRLWCYPGDPTGR